VLILLVLTLLMLRLPEGMSAQKGLEYGGYAAVGFYLSLFLYLQY
jgi:hypothetical protein